MLGTYACRYEVKKGTPVQEARPEVRVKGGHVAGSPSQVAIENAMLIISGSHDNTIKIWNASTGELQSATLNLRGHKYVPSPCIECLLS